MIQNFRQCRAILIIGTDFNAEALERTLGRLGLSVCRFEAVNRVDLDPDRDIVFVDADQAIATSLLVQPGSNLPDAPVIGLVGVEAPSRLKMLAELGATAMLKKPVQGAMVYSALFLGVNTYRRLRSAEARLAAGDLKRRRRRSLIKAVVALVQARALGDDEAYAELRRESMRRRLDLEEFCETLLQPGSGFPETWPPGAPSSPLDREDTADGQDPQAQCRDDGADGSAGRVDQARRA